MLIYKDWKIKNKNFNLVKKKKEGEAQLSI